MKRPGLYLVLWGSYLAVSAGILWYWSYALPSGGGCRSATCVSAPFLAPALLTASAGLCAGFGLVILARRATGIDSRSRLSVAYSLDTVVVALGVVCVALGGAVGLWMVWIGLGIAAFGVAGLGREWLAGRRAVEERSR